MDQRGRKRILGQGGIQAVSPPEIHRGEKLERDLEGSPVQGKRLRQRLRNFHQGVDSYVASLGGPRPYMQRLRDIDAGTERHLQRLHEAWSDLARECQHDAAAFADRWRMHVERLSFSDVNNLIETHNRFFPIESRLPMDVRRRDFALINGKSYRREQLDAACVLERFPPDHAVALQGHPATGGRAVAR